MYEKNTRRIQLIKCWWLNKNVNLSIADEKVQVAYLGVF